ncbi:MAG: MmcQ/YjbR family DNA-binding protein [Acidobacteriaceae bacterium]
MDPETTRAFLLTLPHVAETVQWGDNLVFWAADKSVGGKMFAVVGLSPDRGAVLSFAAGPERFAELVEREGIFPAPYLARAHWVAVERWSALPAAELKALLRDARDLVYAKLPARTRARLESSPAQRKPANKKSAKKKPVKKRPR